MVDCDCARGGHGRKDAGMMPSRPGWLAPSARFALAEDEVHVWRARLDWPAQSAARLEPLLSPDERERVRRVFFFRVPPRPPFCPGRAPLSPLPPPHLPPHVGA